MHPRSILQRRLQTPHLRQAMLKQSGAVLLLPNSNLTQTEYLTLHQNILCMKTKTLLVFTSPSSVEYGHPVHRTLMPLTNS